MRWTPDKNGLLFCSNSGQPKDTCFCEKCLLEESSNAPAWQPPDETSEPQNAELTVNYVLEQIKLLTDTVRKANRTMARGSVKQQPAKAQNGIQRLELKDLNSDKKRCVLEWAGDPSEIGVNFDWALVAIKFRAIASGVKRTYTMGEGNPILDCLDAAFGEGWEKDSSRWEGREFMLWKVKEGILEKEFIRLAVLDKDGNEIPFNYKKVESGSKASATSF